MVHISKTLVEGNNVKRERRKLIAVSDPGLLSVRRSLQGEFEDGTLVSLQ